MGKLDEDLLSIPNPPIYWVVVLTGTRRSNGETVQYHCLKGHNVRRIIAGKVVHFRDVWIPGSEVTWTKAVTKANKDANRSFFGSGLKGAGEKGWKFRPDAQMPEIDG